MNSSAISVLIAKNEIRDADMLHAPHQRISVMIVEDDNVTRRILCKAIESDPAFELVAQFDSVAPTLEWLQGRADGLDVCLTDL